MIFLFFTAADTPLFSRSDAEQATWTVEEYSLQCLFPYDAEKPIQRGQRIGFKYDGAWQLFEIRKVKTYEPDHYQEITAEHIAISELTDEHFYQTKITDETAGDVVEVLLDGTQWEIGNDTSSGTQSADLGTGSVWQDLMTVQTNWNVYIVPRVTVGSTGITGRYLDISPAEGVWHGVRLSIDKNADEIGVTIDDSELYTALYGYGAGVKDGDETVPMTFADIEWSATAEHPQKPLGQKYIEDPNATALYGRNGQPRFGFYQNASINNAETLLEYTWESLTQCNKPKVTIDCQVRDLYRLGYADEPISLHDTAFVEVSPIGEKYQLEIIRLTVDLLDPTATRPTIGAYIPNIIYINREVAKKSGGGGGGRGKSDAENEKIEFETAITANEYQIQLRATQYDLNATNHNVALAQSQINQEATKITSLVTGTGAQLDENGNLIVDANGNPIFTTDGSGLYSKISQNAQQIALRVVKGDVATQLAVEAGNVSITGGNLLVEGYATVQALNATNADIENLVSGRATASVLKAGSLYTAGDLFVGGTLYQPRQIGFSGSMPYTTVLATDHLSLNHYHSITFVPSGGVVNVTLGAPQASEGTGSFDIAATSFYQDGVAAAYARGVADGAGSIAVNDITAAVSGSPFWSGNVYKQPMQLTAVHDDGGGNVDILKQVTQDVDLTTVYNNGKNSVTLSEGWNSNGTYSVTASNGRSHSTTFTDLVLNSTQINPNNNHLLGVFGIKFDNTQVISKTLDIQSVVSGVSVSSASSTTSLDIHNDSQGTWPVSVYIRLSNGNSYTRSVNVSIRTYD